MIITKTPFRISLLGGGTDFPSYYNEFGGQCLSTTINKYCYVYLRELEGVLGPKNEFVYSKIERVGYDLNEIQHPIIREALKYWKVNGIRIDYDADIPARTGLGTSSAFAVGLINALNEYKGSDFDKFRIANQAIYLERVLCNEVGGVQDQIESSFGGVNHIILDRSGYDVKTVNAPELKLRNLENNLLLFYTGIQRTSSDIQKTVHVSEEKIKQVLHKIKELVSEGLDCLVTESRSIDDFGELLHEAWLLKKQISTKVSNEEIDSLYQQGIECGALGGKILGAGGGGFLLFYVQPMYQPKIREHFKNMVEVPFNFENNGTRIIYTDMPRHQK